jgi:hypothetical protein
MTIGYLSYDPIVSIELGPLFVSLAEAVRRRPLRRAAAATPCGDSAGAVGPAGGLRR